jgi:hypothetical protein
MGFTICRLGRRDPWGTALRALRWGRAFTPAGSAVEFQPIDDFVDHLALCAHGDPDEIEVRTRDRLHHLAVGRVMRRSEHVLGIERRRHFARQRPSQRARQRCAVGAIDQDRLADEREISGAGTVFIGATDTGGKGGGNAAGEKMRRLSASAMALEIGPDHDRNLGVELHDCSSRHPGRLEEANIVVPQATVCETHGASFRFKIPSEQDAKS